VKKIKRDYQERYPFVRLYKNDLDDLIAIFEKHCKEVKLKTDEYELTDASQLNNTGKQMITELTIGGRLEEHSYSDDIYLWLSKQTAHLRIAEVASAILLIYSAWFFLHKDRKSVCYLFSE
jgi:hypothetical protein